MQSEDSAKEEGKPPIGEADHDPEPATKIVETAVAARRMICLQAVFRRCGVEARLLGSKTTAEAADLKTEARNLNGWLKDERLWQGLSYRERSWLELRPGDWKLELLKQIGWRVEALGVIAWALGLADLIPAYDKQLDEKSAVMTPEFPQGVPALVSVARLRSESEIEAARETAEAWLWRARTTFIQKNPEKYPPPDGWTYEEIIGAAAKNLQEKGLFKAIRNDFPALGKSYAELSDEEWQTLRSIAGERLYGLNWLCGYAEDWDRVPTGT